MTAPVVTARVTASDTTRDTASILVVDDEASIRQALRVTLLSCGFEVAEAATGEQAIALIRGTGRYDAVLLDMNMPGMGGMSACREIRQFSQSGPIRRRGRFVCLRGRCGWGLAPSHRGGCEESID